MIRKMKDKGEEKNLKRLMAIHREVADIIQRKHLLISEFNALASSFCNDRDGVPVQAQLFMTEDFYAITISKGARMLENGDTEGFLVVEPKEVAAIFS